MRECSAGAGARGTFMDLEDIKHKTGDELIADAAALGIDGAARLRRQDLVFAIARAHGQRKVELRAEGVLEVLGDGFGFLRAPDADFEPGFEDVYVSPSQIRRFELRTGDTVRGLIRAPKDTERYFALLKVEAVNAGAPGARTGTGFDERAALPPERRIALTGDVTSRAIDLLCPLGFGDRCLLIAPPGAGRTTALAALAAAVTASHPEATVIRLLVDQRPEEVTLAERADTGEVVASTLDEPAARHVQVADIVVEKAKRLAEGGTDVVLLVDSLTRLTRAYDSIGSAGGKALPGGLDPAAVHRTRRLLAAARALEGAGSLTIVAGLASDTGSRRDAILVEELADTAPAVIRLDAGLAARRIFPALDLARTASHRAARLLGDDAADRLAGLRSELCALPADEAIARVRERVG